MGLLVAQAPVPAHVPLRPWCPPGLVLRAAASLSSGSMQLRGRSCSVALLCLPLPRCPGGRAGRAAEDEGLAWAGSGQLILTLTLIEQVASLRGPTAIWRWLLTKCPPNSRPGTLQVRLLGCEQLLMAVPGRSPMAVLAGSPSEGWLRTRSRQLRGGELASE